MRALIIYSHPNPRSFNASILAAVKEELTGKGISYEVRDLYARRFNPILSMEDITRLNEGKVPHDIAAEQRLIREADMLVFISPVWWSSFTTMMHGYLDRVFSVGFAYDVESNDYNTNLALAGKKAIVITTCGESGEQVANQMSYGEILTDIIKNHIFGFVGMPTSHKNFFAVGFVLDEDRQKMLDEVRAFIKAEA